MRHRIECYGVSCLQVERQIDAFRTIIIVQEHSAHPRRSVAADVEDTRSGKTFRSPASLYERHQSCEDSSENHY